MIHSLLLFYFVDIKLVGYDVCVTVCQHYYCEQTDRTVPWEHFGGTGWFPLVILNHGNHLGTHSLANQGELPVPWKFPRNMQRSQDHARCLCCGHKVEQSSHVLSCADNRTKKHFK